MLEINEKDKKFIKVDTLPIGKFILIAAKDKELMESHLRDCIANSWEIFTKEIGMSGIKWIGKEVRPYKFRDYSIDILAFDLEKSNFIIFELKRDKNKDQFLQSLSYAAMVDKWRTDGIPKRVKSKLSEWGISNNEINFGIKIVLIAESFGPRVSTTADWFISEYKFDICAFSIEYKLNRKNILIEIKSELFKELSKDFEKQQKNEYQKKIEAWTKEKEKVKRPFINDAIDDLLNKEYETDIDKQHNRFYINHHQDGFGIILIYFYPTICKSFFLC